MKACGGGRGMVHSFLTSALNEGEWSTSRPQTVYLTKELRTLE